MQLFFLDLEIIIFPKFGFMFMIFSLVLYFEVMNLHYEYDFDCLSQ